VKLGMNAKITVDHFVDFENTMKIMCNRLLCVSYKRCLQVVCNRYSLQYELTKSVWHKADLPQQYLFVSTVIKRTVLIIEGYLSYQLHNLFCSPFFEGSYRVTEP
jgi:hypothetical protein